MAQQGFGGATAAFQISKQYTSLELIGARDCDPDYPQKYPDLLVWGGASIHKSMCVGADGIFGGDVVVEGNLTVLGKEIVQQVELVVVKDKNLCLGNVDGASSDITANGGGILLKGPQPDGSKSFLWYNDIGPNGSWRSNQDIDIGAGRWSSECPSGDCGCGSDEGLQGFAYRIDGNAVIDASSLGFGIVDSLLQSVGTLRSGAIDNGNPILSTTPAGALTTIETAHPHGLTTGDQIIIQSSVTSPTLDGLRTVIVTSPTEFNVSVSTSSTTSNAGAVYGADFPINIGLSPLTSGSSTVNNGGFIRVLNTAGQTTFLADGTTEQTSMSNTTSQAYTSGITSSITGSFNGVQRSQFIQNYSESDTTSSRSVASDITQWYGGTNTAFTNFENTVQSIGERVVMSVSTQTPLPKMSSRAIDVTSNSQNNRGSNIGVIAESGGPVGSDDSIGVMGFSNPSSGTFSAGVVGSANNSRSDMATEIASRVSAGGMTVGVYASNDLTGANDYGLYVDGRTNLSGDVTIGGDVNLTGNTNQTGNVTISGESTSDSVVTNQLSVSGPGVIGSTQTNTLGAIGSGTEIDVAASLIPDNGGSGNCLTLGSPDHPWCKVYATDIITDTVTANTVATANLAIDNITANTITTDFLFSQFSSLNNAFVNILGGLNGSDINVDDNLIPTINNFLTLGNATNVWASGWFGDVTAGNLSVTDQLTLNDIHVLGDAFIDGNLTVTGKLQFGDLELSGNLIVHGQTTLGNVTATSIETQIITTSVANIGDANIGNISVSGNANFVNIAASGEIVTNDLMVIDTVAIGGNLVIAGTTTLEATNINGLLTVNGDQINNGNVVINGPLVVSNSALFDGDIEVSGNTLMHGDLTVEGTTNLDTALIAVANVGNLISNGTFVSNGPTILANTTIQGQLNLDGDQVINGNLTVLGHTNLIGGVSVIGNLDAAVINSTTIVSDHLNVTGNTTLVDVDISGVVTANTLIVTENAALLGTTMIIDAVVTDLTVVGNASFVDVSISNELTVSGNTVMANVDVYGTFTLHGDQLIDGNLIVTGQTTLQNVVINSDLTVINDVIVGGQLGASDIHSNGDISADGNLIVTGYSDLANVQISGNLTVEGISNLSTADIVELNAINASISGNLIASLIEAQLVSIVDLNVYGNAALNNASVNQLHVTSDQVVDGNLTVLGKTTLENVMIDELTINSGNIIGNLLVGGELLANSIYASGNIITSGSLTVDGPSTLSDTIVDGTLLVTGDETVDGNLTVQGQTNLTGNLNVVGSTAITGTLNINADAIVTGNTTFIGDISVSGNIIGSSVTAISIIAQDASFGNVNALFGAFDSGVFGNVNASSGVFGSGVFGSGVFEDLTVTGNTTLNNTTITTLTVDSIFITGSQVIGGNLQVIGVTSLTDATINELVAGNVNVENRLTSDEIYANYINIDSGDVFNLNVGGNLFVSGSTTLGNVDIAELTVDSLHVTGDQLIDGNIIVLGSTTLDSVDISNAHITGNLIVDGIITTDAIVADDGLFGNITVTGMSNLNMIVASGNAVFQQSVEINGLLDVFDLHVLNNALVDGGLTVTGATQLTQLSTVDADLSGNLTVFGLTTMNSATIVDLSVAGNLSVSGPTALVELTVTGNARVEDTLLVDNHVFIGGNLSVAGVSNLNDLNVSGNVSMSGVIQIGGEVFVPPVALQTLNEVPVVAVVMSTEPNTGYLMKFKAIGLRDDRDAAAMITVNASFVNNNGVLRKVGVDDVLNFSDLDAEDYSLTASESGTDILASVQGSAATAVNWSVFTSYVMFTA